MIWDGASTWVKNEERHEHGRLDEGDYSFVVDNQS